MYKKIKFPPELRGGRIGTGWYHDYVKEEPDKLNILATGLLKNKLAAIFKIAQEKNIKEKEDGCNTNRIFK